MKAKLFDNTEYLIDDVSLPKSIVIQAAIAPGGTGQWINTLEMELDTGADIVSIPLPILKKIGLADKLFSEDNILSENADGSESKAPIVKIDLRIPTTSGQYITFFGVLCMVPPDGSVSLLGRSILSHLTIMLNSGQITHMEYRSSLNFKTKLK